MCFIFRIIFFVDDYMDVGNKRQVQFSDKKSILEIILLMTFVHLNLILIKLSS